MLHLVELHVADQLGLAVLGLAAGNAHVDDDRARLDPVAPDELGRAGRGDDDIGLAAQVGEVFRFDVRYGHGRLALEHQHGDRLADDVGLADHHHVETGHVVVHRVEQLGHAERGARNDAARAGRQAADVDRVEAVDILARRDRAQHDAGVDVRGQGNLDQDAVDFGIGIEPGNQR